MEDSLDGPAAGVKDDVGVGGYEDVGGNVDAWVGAGGGWPQNPP